MKCVAVFLLVLTVIYKIDCSAVGGRFDYSESYNDLAEGSGDPSTESYCPNSNGGYDKCDDKNSVIPDVIKYDRSLETKVYTCVDIEYKQLWTRIVKQCAKELLKGNDLCKIIEAPSKITNCQVSTPEPTTPATKSTTPTSKATSPTSKATSPTSKATSPTSKATTPTSKATTPTSKATTPTSKATSPTSKATSPTSKATTPTSKATTPTSKATTPTSQSTSDTTDPPTTESGSTLSPLGSGKHCKNKDEGDVECSPANSQPPIPLDGLSDDEYVCLDIKVTDPGSGSWCLSEGQKLIECDEKNCVIPTDIKHNTKLETEEYICLTATYQSKTINQCAKKLKEKDLCDELKERNSGKIEACADYKPDTFKDLEYKGCSMKPTDGDLCKNLKKKLDEHFISKIEFTCETSDPSGATVPTLSLTLSFILLFSVYFFQ